MIITFDLWETLIKGSPKFKEERIKLVKKYCSFEDESPLYDQIIDDIFKGVKNKENKVVEIYGNQPDTKSLVAKIFYVIQETLLNKRNKIDLDSFIRDHNNLMLDYPPIIIENTLEVFEKLFNDNHKIGIVSNTMMTPGFVLREILSKNGVSKYLTYREIFSDERGYSKPHNIFIHNADWHVGDNPITDGACIEYGIKYYQINSNNKTIKDFYDECILSNQNK